MIATAPGKLIVAGEYAVLAGMTALVVAVDRRAVASVDAVAERSVVLAAVADQLAQRFGGDSAAARAARAIVVDSGAFYADGQKLGLGSSAAVAVAATALALASIDETCDRAVIFDVASTAHRAAQGGVGSGADIAAAVHGGTIAFTRGRVEPLGWPAGVTLLPFFTGVSAPTTALVDAVCARGAAPLEAALIAIGDASAAAIAAIRDRAPAAVLIDALAAAGRALDHLAAVSGVDLVPSCVTRARAALGPLGGTAKTTGAGGGDVAIAVLPAVADATIATRLLIECGCSPLALAVGAAGVDLRPSPQ